MNDSQIKIQDKWKKGFVLGYDCITYANDEIVIGSVYRTKNSNNGEIKQSWIPKCDTQLEKIEKYNNDIWVECEIYNGSFEFENQKIVFGDGEMGNEGFIASTKLNGELNWSIFFTFSNPIFKAEVINNLPICNNSDTKITIDLNELTNIKIDEIF
ncbi:MAG: hypothetical protein V3V28_02655 [Polaribacter sp.]|uniref:hypothetical protein n=1 Tax=Polaribacter sp. TaxID=1920175 RepID=UPI002F35BEB1